MRCPRCGEKLRKIIYGNGVYYSCRECDWATKASRKIEEEFGSFSDIL